MVIRKLTSQSMIAKDPLTFWMCQSMPFQRMFLVSMAPTKNLKTNLKWPTQNKIFYAVYRIACASGVRYPVKRRK